jgi:hypothetical protein
LKKKYLCHVDFFGLYNLYNEKFKKKNLLHIFNEILNELKIETIYLATFNYDYLKFGKTTHSAKSQLNKITRLVQNQKNFKQTFDPVFSFCTNDKKYKFKIIKKFFDVKYRYKKQFIGNYKYKNKNNKIIYDHMVWPITKKFCNYDAKKINNDMIKDGIWNVIKSKNGFYIKKANIKTFNNYIVKKVRNDPFYPVHIKTQTWMKKFLKKKKKISIENFEK